MTGGPVVAARRPPLVSQFVSDLVYGDAVSNDCLNLDRLLRGFGYRTRLFVQRVGDQYRSRTQRFDAYAPETGEVALLHYSVWSDLAQFARDQVRAPLVLVYHNVTPPEYFAGLHPQAEQDTRLGRDSLPTFRERAALALGKSGFSAAELKAAGFSRTGVLPVAVDLAALHRRADERVRRRYADGYVNVLSVGRVVPNKRPEDTIKLFYHYHRSVNPRSRLLFVGPKLIAGDYLFWLERLVERLGLDPHVEFVGQVSRAELATYYRLAHAYVSMSEHEGFGVPLVEALSFGLPVLARAAAAVPETLDGAGVLVRRACYAALAELLDLLVRPGPLRAALAARGRARARAFSLPAVGRQLAAYLAALGYPPPGLVPGGAREHRQG
ncbi:MAG: glycosyltransferase family 4 protein [Chloroflexi bacterium]|nr:glycosyltransferase family 4 protein [Chloroflexota bacterium]